MAFESAENTESIILIVSSVVTILGGLYAVWKKSKGQPIGKRFKELLKYLLFNATKSKTKRITKSRQE